MVIGQLVVMVPLEAQVMAELVDNIMLVLEEQDFHLMVEIAQVEI